VYKSQQECEAVCAFFPSDPAYMYTGADQSNSFECRAQQAYVAGNSSFPDPEIGGVKCQNADFFGGQDPFTAQPGLCVVTSHCEMYCILLAGVCTGSNANFQSDSDCINYCESGIAWTDQGDGTNTDDSIQCRLIAVQSATLNPNEWCPATSLLGGGVCGTECENYCTNRAIASCTDPSCGTECPTYKTTGSLIGFGGDNNLECFNANTVQASYSGDLSFCNNAIVCPVFSSSSVASSSAISSSFSPSSSQIPSSSAVEGGSSCAGRLSAGVFMLIAIGFASLSVYIE